MAAATSVHAVTIIEPIIQHADWFFPEGEKYHTELYSPKKEHFKIVKQRLMYIHVICLDVEFNVSGMFSMPTPMTNNVNHLTISDYDSGTTERKRPNSMVGPDSDMARRDRYTH